VKQAVFRIRIRIRIDFGRLDPDAHWECGGSARILVQEGKKDPKNGKKNKMFSFCSLL
jgi:hypothetical protein